MSGDPRQQPGSPEEASRAPESEALRDCSHLVALLADAVEALEQKDFPRLRELESMRARLAGEMREADGTDTPLLSWLAGRIEASLLRVEAWMEADRLSRQEVAQLRDDSLPLVRGLTRRPGAGSYRPLDSGSAKLDVRL